MNEYDFIIDQFTYSFSRLNSFYSNCKREFKRVYIDCADKASNFFAEAGLSAHVTLEKYAKGEIDVFELSQVFEDEWESQVKSNAPYNKYVDLFQQTHDKMLDYFDNIDLDLEKYEVLGVEKEIRFEISGKPFVGYIDLLLRDKETGDITIADHKSASIKFLKNGSVSKGDRDHVQAFIRQLALYSKAVIDEYGPVKYLAWNLFKQHDWYQIEWTQEIFDEAMSWAEQAIKDIESEENWDAHPEETEYYCRHLCSQRFDCPEKEIYMAEKYPPKEESGDEYYDPNQ